MSNYLIIPAVTRAFKILLERAASVVNNSTVTTGVPKVTTSANINVFLYEVTHKTDFINPGPFENSADNLLRIRQQVALYLNYLISFYGEENGLEAQRLMGNTISLLHENPILIIDGIWNDIESKPNLTRSDLGSMLHVLI